MAGLRRNTHGIGLMSQRLTGLRRNTHDIGLMSQRLAGLRRNTYGIGLMSQRSESRSGLIGGWLRRSGVRKELVHRHTTFTPVAANWVGCCGEGR